MFEAFGLDRLFSSLRIQGDFETSKKVSDETDRLDESETIDRIKKSSTALQPESCLFYIRFKYCCYTFTCTEVHLDRVSNLTDFQIPCIPTCEKYSDFDR